MKSEIIKPLTRQEQFVLLYEHAFPKVASFVSKSGGNFDNAKDIFQDALVAFHEKKAVTETTAITDEVAYIIGMSKFLWYKKFREEKSLVMLEEVAFSEQIPEHEPLVSKRLLQFVEASGKKCLELLKAFYYEKRTMKELATDFNFSGERSATAQKYKCLEKVRGAIKDHSLSKDDFYE